jgi:hypothetical protein
MILKICAGLAVAFLALTSSIDKASAASSQVSHHTTSATHVYYARRYYAPRYYRPRYYTPRYYYRPYYRPRYYYYNPY